MSKRVIAVIIAIVVPMVIFTIYLTRLGPAEFEPTEAYGFIELPNPETTGTMSVEEAIRRRRSIRSYADKPLSLQDVSQLMWAAQGITDPAGNFRAAPSAGATYPLEVYVVVGKNRVTGLGKGLYCYDPYEHRLEYILKGDLRSSLAEAALRQGWVREAPISIVITAVYERTTGRYGERGIRYVHMEAGHVGQNLYLQATARRLAMVTVGAFHDDQVQELLRLPKNQKPLYIIPVGHPGS
ncbi:MAG: SagB/ThcOx family dehydrogenase [Thermoproteota archaeon]